MEVRPPGFLTESDAAMDANLRPSHHGKGRSKLPASAAAVFVIAHDAGEGGADTPERQEIGGVGGRTTAGLQQSFDLRLAVFGGEFGDERASIVRSVPDA